MKHLPPHLQRRSFLKLGIGAAVVLAVAGGAVALIKPGLVNGRLSPSARLLMGLIATHPLQAVLTGDASLSRRPMARSRPGRCCGWPIWRPPNC